MIDMCRKLLACYLIISSSYLYLVTAAPSQKTRTGENEAASGQNKPPFNFSEKEAEFYWPLELSEENGDDYGNAEPNSKLKQGNANQGNSKSQDVKAKGSEKNDISESMWKEKVHKIFTNWGFTDEQIPKPFGSLNNLKLTKSIPHDFDKTLKDMLTTAPDAVKEKLKELLESNKENKGNAAKKSNSKSKTICAGKTGLCSTQIVAYSTNKPDVVKHSTRLPASHGKHGQGQQQTLDELIKSMEEITNEQNKLTEKEVDKIRQIISKMSELIRELQDAARNCGNEHSTSGQQPHEMSNGPSKNSKTKKMATKQGSITEVEEKHTVERKIFTLKEHDETLMHPNNATEHEFDSEVSNTGDVFASPVLPSDNTYSSLAPPVWSTPTNYLVNAPADVNYNGGINSPMDALKQKYPHGHWPDEGNDNVNVDTDNAQEWRSSTGNNAIGNDVQMHASNSHELERNEIEEHNKNINNYYDDDDNNDYEDYTLDYQVDLSPEYLEAIIRFEHASQNKSTIRTHHVQQHDLATVAKK